MATHDYVIDDAAGATFRADINNMSQAIVSQNSSATAPSPSFAYQTWNDSTAEAFKIRNAANTAWLTLWTYDQANDLFRIDFDKGADIASATTTDIGAATGNYVVVTGTTTITGLGTIKAGTHRWVRFSGILTLTHNATSLILPGGADITTAAGDVMLAISEGSGNWRVPIYGRASGVPLGSTVGNLIGFQTFTASGTWTPTVGTQSVVVEAKGSGGGGGGADSSGATNGRAGGGGGEGETAVVRITAGLGATETITIGAAGTAGAATGGTGGVGGTTSFGSHVTAIGGNGGAGTTSSGSTPIGVGGGLGGTGGTGADIAYAGQAGFGGQAESSAATALFGGNGGGRGGGRGGVTNGAGGAGDSGGGGGGGATTDATGSGGGVGGAGYILVWEYS